MPKRSPATKKQQGVRRVCSRGHMFYYSSLCPICPKCWSGYYREKRQGNLPAGLGAPALRALLNAKISSLEKVAKHRPDELLALHGFGKKALNILRVELQKHGQTLAR